MKLIELFENYNLPTTLKVEKLDDSLYNFKVFNYLNKLLPRYTKKNISIEDLAKYKNELILNFPDLTVVENKIPGHMGIDFLEDTMINYTEINAIYNNQEKDIDKTLNTLSSQNPSWRKLIELRGWGYARNKLIKALRKI